MKESLKKISEMVAGANDQFAQLHPGIDTVMGIMDKTLRKQGMPADAVTIDAISLDKKIVILMHDNLPNKVEVALGNKAGDIFSSSQQDTTSLSTENLLTIFTHYFIPQH